MKLRGTWAERRERVALITGASGGIGSACVRRFAEEGWQVAATALPGPDLDRLSGLRVLILPGDLTSERTRSSIVEHAIGEFGRIDALVNCAGSGLYCLPSSLSLELTRRLFELNVLAPLAMAQAVMPAMRRVGSGTIVNVGSVGGCVSLPWAAAYSASKFALRALNDALRRELRNQRIHVMDMRPGIVDTGFRNNVLGGAPPGRVENIRWMVSPEAVANGILDGIRKRRRTVYVPKIGLLFRLADLFSASVMDWYMGRLLKGYGSAAPASIPEGLANFAGEPGPAGITRRAAAAPDSEGAG